MSDAPENDAIVPESNVAQREASPTVEEIPSPVHDDFPYALLDLTPPEEAAPTIEPLLFQSWSQPKPLPPTRIPNFGHLCILCLLVSLATVCAVLLTWSALHFHLFGVTTMQQANTDIHYSLGSMVILELLSLLGCLLDLSSRLARGFFCRIAMERRHSFSSALVAVCSRGHLLRARHGR